MPRPDEDPPEWASDDEYPAGAEPEAEEDNKVEPLAGKKAIGWRPVERPSPRALNWFMNLVWLWLVWLDAASTRKITRGAAIDWTKLSGAATVIIETWSGVGTFRVGIPIVEGETIDNIRFHYDRGGSGTVTLRVGWREYAADVYVQSLVEEVGAIVAGTGEAHTDVTGDDLEALAFPIDATAGVNEIYWVEVENDDAANVLIGATFTLRRAA